MHDLIMATCFGGLRMFRTTGFPALYMDDPSVLEIMDAETGELYKYTPGLSFMNDIDWARIDEGYEL